MFRKLVIAVAIVAMELFAGAPSSAITNSVACTADLQLVVSAARLANLYVEARKWESACLSIKEALLHARMEEHDCGTPAPSTTLDGLHSLFKQMECSKYCSEYEQH